jgi:hypothetical protein
MDEVHIFISETLIFKKTPAVQIARLSVEATDVRVGRTLASPLL